MKTPTLQEVLEYSNRDVVYRFAKNYGMTLEESEDIFNQVKKWLWLSHRRRLTGAAGHLSIDLSLVVIDEMWHNFVLFTREYVEFCKTYFGCYMHHAPATEAEEAEHHGSFEGLTRRERLEAVKNAKRPQYNFVHTQLGEETFVKWYMEYPRKYSYETLAEMQLEAVRQKLASLMERGKKARPEVAA